MEVTAHFVHAVAIQYEDHYKKLSAAKAATDKDDDGGAAAADAAVEKQCANLAAVLAYLYCCRAVHSTIMMDILKRHLDNFNDADVELILVGVATLVNQSSVPARGMHCCSLTRDYHPKRVGHPPGCRASVTIR
jgi:hypothetical protein